MSHAGTCHFSCCSTLVTPSTRQQLMLVLHIASHAAPFLLTRQDKMGRSMSAKLSFTPTLLFLMQFYAAKGQSFRSSRQRHTNHTLHCVASNATCHPSRRSLSYGTLGPTLQGPLNASHTVAYCKQTTGLENSSPLCALRAHAVMHVAPLQCSSRFPPRCLREST